MRTFVTLVVRHKTSFDLKNLICYKKHTKNVVEIKIVTYKKFFDIFCFILDFGFKTQPFLLKCNTFIMHVLTKVNTTLFHKKIRVNKRKIINKYPK